MNPKEIESSACLSHSYLNYSFHRTKRCCIVCWFTLQCAGVYKRHKKMYDRWEQLILCITLKKLVHWPSIDRWILHLVMTERNYLHKNWAMVLLKSIHRDNGFNLKCISWTVYACKVKRGNYMYFIWSFKNESRKR